MSEKEKRLRALDLTPWAARYKGGGEPVVLVLTPDSYVKALTAKQAKIAYEAGKLIGWKPFDTAPPPTEGVK